MSSITYPATYEFEPPDRVANWRPLVQWILVIPHTVVMYVLGLAGAVVALISWFAIVFTGKLPEGLAGVQAMVLRYQARVFTYMFFLREDYPPFGFETTASDPGEDGRTTVTFEPALADRNRLTTFFRFIMVIPHAIVLGILGIGFSIVLIIAWFAVLFTGRWPEGLRRFALGLERWYVRYGAYAFLLTDEYPPFSLD